MEQLGWWTHGRTDERRDGRDDQWQMEILVGLFSERDSRLLRIESLRMGDNTGLACDAIHRPTTLDLCCPLASKASTAAAKWKGVGLDALSDRLSIHGTYVYVPRRKRCVWKRLGTL